MCCFKTIQPKNLLYMYFRSENAKLFLETHALKMADPTRCNDPFECKYDVVFDKQKLTPYDELYKYVENELKKCGIACFTTKNNSILMWAYYAESQKGVCIEFAPDADPVAFSDLYSVKYKSKWPIVYEKWNDTIDKLEILRTKSEEWQHENEVRLIKQGYSGRTLTLNPKSITGIIFGYNVEHFYDNRFDESRRNTLEQIIGLLQKPEYAHIIIKQMQKQNDEYELHASPVHCLVWQDKDKLIITSLIQQVIKVTSTSGDLYYTSDVSKWEKVYLDLNEGEYYIESDSQKGFVKFNVETYHP